MHGRHVDPRRPAAQARAVTWRFHPWTELSLDDLYAILVLRSRVFVVEQNCPYLDPDGLDRASHHLWSGDAAILAYLRVVPPGAKYDEPSLGRVVTAPEARRAGLGRPLVREGLRRVEALYGPVPVRIGAQKYLERFYGELGFVRASDDYDEDGIPHMEMVRTGQVM
jgi:ElaA protein